MNKQRVEENYITFFHLEVQAGDVHRTIPLDTKVGLVNLTLPFGVNMSQELSFMGSRENIQRTVLFIGVLK
jgi:hypothetical protein